MLPATPNINVDHWIAACVALIITISCIITYHTVRYVIPTNILTATDQSVSDMIVDKTVEVLQKEIVPMDTLRKRLEDYSRKNMHVVPSSDGITVVKRPDSPQAIHPSQLPVQSAEQAIQLMRTEQQHATPPIKLVRIQNYATTPVTTLYVKPTATPQTYPQRK